MHVEFTGRQCTATPKLKSQALTYLERIVPMSHGITGAHFIFTEDKYRRIVEAEVYCRAGNLFAKCEGTDMEQALLDALHRIEQQVVRLKERDQTLRDRAKPVASEVPEIPEAFNVAQG